MFDDAVFTVHARREMLRRGIVEEQVWEVLKDPESVLLVRTGRIVAQGITFFADSSRQYLLRIFIDVDRSPAEIVTVYRTSKLAKYRRTT